MQQTVQEWAHVFQLPVSTLRQRIKRSGRDDYKSGDLFEKEDFAEIGIDPETGAYTRKNSKDSEAVSTKAVVTKKVTKKSTKSPTIKTEPTEQISVGKAKDSIVDAVFGSQAITLAGSLVLVILGGFAFKVIAESALPEQSGAGAFWGSAGAFVHFSGLLTIYRVHKQEKSRSADYHQVWNWIAVFFVFELTVHVCSLLAGGATNYFQIAVMAVCAPLAAAGFSSVLFHKN